MYSLAELAKATLRQAHLALGSSYSLLLGDAVENAEILSHRDGTQADLEPLSVDAAVRMGIAPEDAEAAQEIWMARLRREDFPEESVPVNETYWIDDGEKQRAFRCVKRTESKVQGLEWELILVRG